MDTERRGNEKPEVAEDNVVFERPKECSSVTKEFTPPDYGEKFSLIENEQQLLASSFRLFSWLSSVYGFYTFGYAGQNLQKTWRQGSPKDKSLLILKVAALSIWFLVFTVVISWHFIGWSINVGTYLYYYVLILNNRVSKEQDGTVIPGWFEISINKGFSGFVGLLLSFVSVYQWFLWIFMLREANLERLFISILRCNKNYLDAIATKNLIRKTQLHSVLFTALSVAYGIGATAAGISVNATRGFYSQIITAYPAAAVTYDIGITIISYFLQFTMLMMIASRISLTCELHQHQMKAFFNCLTTTKKFTTVEKAIDAHITIKTNLQRSSRFIERYLSIVSACVFIAIVLQIYSVVSFGFGEIWIRFIYCVIFLAPMTLVWFRCALVASQSMKLIVNTTNLVPSQLPFPERALEFQQHMVLWKLQNHWGFEIFGVTLNFALFIKVYYLLGAAMTFLIQRVAEQFVKI